MRHLTFEVTRAALDAWAKRKLSGVALTELLARDNDMTNIQLAIKMLGKSAWYQRGEMDAESLMDVLSSVATTHGTLLAAIEAKQAQVDALMHEFCPSKMTAAQKLEWGRRQRVSANV